MRLQRRIRLLELKAGDLSLPSLAEFKASQARGTKRAVLEMAATIQKAGLNVPGHCQDMVANAEAILLDDTQEMEAADNETSRLYSEGNWPGHTAASWDQVQTSMQRIAEFMIEQWDLSEEVDLEAAPLIQVYLAAGLLLGLREKKLRESDNSD